MTIDNIGREKPAGATIRVRRCKVWPGAEYYLVLPETVGENTPVLVSVHGISRNAREHAKTFATACNTFGCAVVAPLFTANRFPGYQRLGYGRKRTHPRSDLALNAILDKVADRTGARTDKIYMFGYSGGAGSQPCRRRPSAVSWIRVTSSANSKGAVIPSPTA